MAQFEAANALKGATGYDINLALDDGTVVVNSGTAVEGQVGGADKILDLLDGAPADSSLTQLPILRCIVNVTAAVGDGFDIRLQASSSETFATVDEGYIVAKETVALTEAKQYALDIRPKSRYLRIQFDGGASLTSLTRPNPGSYITAISH